MPDEEHLPLSSTQKGRDLEEEVFSILQTQPEKLGLRRDRETSAVYLLKRYPLRDAGLVVDVSVEHYPSTDKGISTLPFQVWAFECKNVEAPIERRTVEGAYQAITDAFGSSGVFFFVCTSNLRRGALSFCKEKRIAVLRRVPVNHDHSGYVYRWVDNAISKRSSREGYYRVSAETLLAESNRSGDVQTATLPADSRSYLGNLVLTYSLGMLFMAGLFLVSFGWHRIFNSEFDSLKSLLFSTVAIIFVSAFGIWEVTIRRWRNVANPRTHTAEKVLLEGADASTDHLRHAAYVIFRYDLDESRSRA